MPDERTVFERIFKSSMSVAHDMLTRIEIDWPAKTIALTTTTQRRRPFLAFGRLVEALRFLEQEAGIVAWHDDASRRRSPWAVSVRFGGRILRVEAIRQLDGKLEIEIHPRYTLDELLPRDGAEAMPTDDPGERP